MNVTLAPIKPILRIEDICELLGISRTQFYDLKESFFERHSLLVEVQPPIDRSPRYSGEPFVRWLGDRNQQRLWREQMKPVATRA